MQRGLTVFILGLLSALAAPITGLAQSEPLLVYPAIATNATDNIGLGSNLNPFATTQGARSEPQPTESEEKPARDDDGSEAAASDGLVDDISLINTDYLASYVENSSRILTGPLRYDANDWINATIVALGAGALFLLDETILDFWQDNIRSSATNDVGDIFRELGEFDYILGGSLSAYALAELLGAKREQAAALLTLESFLLTAVLVHGIKYVTGRQRPEKTDNAFDFEGPSKGELNTSFPSGHAGNAFAVASVLAEVYRDDYPWLPWLAYSAATGVVLTRVNHNKHWISDVFIGGVFGYFIGKMVVRHTPFMEQHNISVRPFVQKGAVGAALTLRF